jgi:hypothetical protein
MITAYRKVDHVDRMAEDRSPKQHRIKNLQGKEYKEE